MPASYELKQNETSYTDISRIIINMNYILYYAHIHIILWIKNSNQNMIKPKNAEKGLKKTMHRYWFMWS